MSVILREKIRLKDLFLSSGVTRPGGKILRRAEGEGEKGRRGDGANGEKGRWGEWTNGAKGRRGEGEKG